MTIVSPTTACLLVAVPALLLAGACSKAHGDPKGEAPPPSRVIPVAAAGLFAVEHPEQFPLVAATERESAPELVVTGTVTPDVSRAVPVTSLVSGRITGIYARLGDTVQKGQRLLTVRSDDISGGFSDYRKAVRTEALTRIQLERAKDLYDHGAIALNDFQVAQQTEDNAKIDVETTAEKLQLRGSDLQHPTGLVDLVSPVSGIITDQQVTNSAGLQSLGTTAFTISDLSSVWVLCDVYENDLPNVHMGDSAEIRLNAYPDRVLRGRVSNISAALDPNIRTAKVRIEVPNPGILRLGMFVQATFHAQRKEVHTVVPAAAIVHIHDRDYVYVPAAGNRFRRIDVVSGDGLPGDLQEVRSGISKGQQVVANALVLEHTIDQ